MSDEYTTWRRDPRQPFVSYDPKTATRTVSRACTASREYLVVRDSGLGLDSHSELTDAEKRRFVDENITPREFDAMNGVCLPSVDRSR